MKKYEEIYNEVVTLLKEEGYDVTTKKVKNYAADCADYIFDSDGTYTTEEWWEDTQKNYPEVLKRLPMVG